MTTRHRCSKAAISNLPKCSSGQCCRKLRSRTSSKISSVNELCFRWTPAVSTFGFPSTSPPKTGVGCHFLLPWADDLRRQRGFVVPPGPWPRCPMDHVPFVVVVPDFLSWLFTVWVMNWVSRAKLIPTFILVVFRLAALALTQKHVSSDVLGFISK